MENRTLLLKIGGSALTDKTSGTFEIDSHRLVKIMKEIKAVKDHCDKIVLVTGVGAHGHVPVVQHRIHKGWLGDPRQLVGLVEAQHRVNVLRNALIKAAWDLEIPVFQCYASSMVQNDKGTIIKAHLDNLKKFSELELIPIMSGDVVPDATMGFSVCSGDDLIFLLAKELQVKEVFFGMNVDGLLTKPPTEDDSQLLPDLDVSRAKSLLTTLEGHDASGGIRGKLAKSIAAIEKGIVTRVTFFNLLRENALLDIMLNEPNVLFTRLHA